MRKKEIMPFVVVYRDIFPDLDNIFRIVKDSENNNIINITGEEWEDWHGVAKKIKMGHQIFVHEDNVSDLDRPAYEDQLYLRKTIFNNFYDCYQDYINEWSDCDLLHSYNSIAKIDPHAYKIFGDYVKNWNINDTIEDLNLEGWMNTTTDFVKYFDYYDRDYILPYHIDNGVPTGNPGSLHILSATLYLNDDYEGGQVSFLNEFFDVVLNYKPKAGDLIIFPADRPFFHAALPTSNGNKYFARHFLCWNSKGSEEYNINLEKFGSEQMSAMQKVIRKSQEEMGLFNKDVYLIGDPISNRSRKNGNLFIAKEIIDMDNNW